MKPRSAKILWSSATLACALLTTVGLIDHALRFPGIFPRPVTKLLAGFIEPGLALGWLAMGKLFRGFPTDWTGYLVAAVANVALWMLALAVSWIVAKLSRALWRAYRRR